MGTTDKGLPFPDGTDPAFVPADIAALAQKLDTIPGVLLGTYAQINALTGVDIWEGRVVYQTDTGAARPTVGVYAHDGITWRLPWNLPWGKVARGVCVASQTITATAEANVGGGWQPVFAAVANRLYRISVSGVWRVAAPSGVTVRVKDGATLIEDGRRIGFASANDDKTFSFAVETALTAGSHTLQVSHQCDNAAGTTCVAANAPLVVDVSDIGPNGSPT